MQHTAPKRRWLRMLRTAASVGCLVACLTFVALWGRSLFWNDTVYEHRPDGYSHLRSWKGQIEFLFLPWSNPTHTLSSGITSNPTGKWQSMVDEGGGVEFKGSEALGFAWGGMRPGGTRAVAPHWFFSLVVGALALAIKPKPRWQFSLRELLVITTFAVLVAGAIGSLHRWD